MTITVLRADAAHLPVATNSVDLIVTSPPYFGLRSYKDAGEHYDGQIGSEATPAEWLDAMLRCSAEWTRVLKPTASLWVNLGDKYSERAGPVWSGSSDRLTGRPPKPRRSSSTSMAPRKSLLGLPWRYAIRCIDELGLLLRAEVIWSKPNGLPESVRDRVRRSHEQWFHFTLQPRYFAALDEIREPHSTNTHARRRDGLAPPKNAAGLDQGVRRGYFTETSSNRLGRVPGSVWEVQSERLVVPQALDVDHFAAFPTEWPRRIVKGWSPTGICTACATARVPVTDVDQVASGRTNSGRAKRQRVDQPGHDRGFNAAGYPHTTAQVSITGYACACPTPDAPVRPGVVLDPFGGTGTTAHVAHALDRDGISVDLSADYCRLAASDELQDQRFRRIRGLGKAPSVTTGQGDLFGEVGA